MKLKLKALICIYSGHRWVYKRGRTRDGQICERCAKVIATLPKPKPSIQIKRTRGKSKPK